MQTTMQTNMETYFGYVKTPQDAIILLEACRRGVLSRVQRRLSEKERAAIRSGSIFVWDEREAGMRRWTDGRTWSPSRVSGSFLTYRELDSKRRSSTTRSPPIDGSQSDSDEAYGTSASSHSSGSMAGSSSKPSFTYKPDGLIKQSFSITANHQKLHLICYYSKQDILNDRLRTPIHDDKLKSISIPKGMYPDANALDVPHPGRSSSSPSSPTSPTLSHLLNNGSNNGNSHHHHHHHQHHRTHSHTHTLNTYEHHRSSPYNWSSSPHQRHHSSSSTSSSSASRFTRGTSSDSFMDQHDSTSFPPTPPSLTSSPDTMLEDDPAEHGYHASEHAYLVRNNSPVKSLQTLPVLPPTSASASSPHHNVMSYASSYPHASITVPPLATGNSSGDDVFPSSAKGLTLPPQDIPLEKIRSSEDDRQLRALYAVLQL